MTKTIPIIPQAVDYLAKQGMKLDIDLASVVAVKGLELEEIELNNYNTEELANSSFEDVAKSLIKLILDGNKEHLTDQYQDEIILKAYSLTASCRALDQMAHQRGSITDSDLLKFLDDNFSNKKVFSTLVHNHGNLLSFASKELRDDKDLIQKAMYANNEPLQHSLEKLKSPQDLKNDEQLLKTSHLPTKSLDRTTLDNIATIFERNKNPPAEDLRTGYKKL
jgi:hypothetical protein